MLGHTHVSTRRRRVALGLGAALCAVTFLPTPFAKAQIVTYHFVGVVKDAIGRPIVGATVGDGSSGTTTRTDGSYSLGETSPGSFVLEASKTNMRGQAQSVSVIEPTDTTVNFSGSYNQNLWMRDWFEGAAYLPH